MLELNYSLRDTATLLYESLSKDFENISKQLKRTGVTLYLLWEEYRQQNDKGFSYSKFCHHYRMWERRQDPQMHMEHKAGDITYMDFTDKKMHVADPDSGEITNQSLLFTSIVHFTPE